LQPFVEVQEEWLRLLIENYEKYNSLSFPTILMKATR